jgi:hypothetical protein
VLLWGSICHHVKREASRFILSTRWDAATGCARGTGTITVTDIDSYGRVWYSLSRGGQQDVPRTPSPHGDKVQKAKLRDIFLGEET